MTFLKYKQKLNFKENGVCTAVHFALASSVAAAAVVYRHRVPCTIQWFLFDETRFCSIVSCYSFGKRQICANTLWKRFVFLCVGMCARTETNNKQRVADTPVYIYI